MYFFNQSIKKYFLFITLFLLCEAAFSETQPESSLTKFGVQLNEIQVNQAIDQYIRQLPSVLEESSRSINLFQKAIEFAQVRYENLRTEANGDIELADKLFFQEINQRKLIYENQDFGLAEFTNIDNSIVIRMLDKMGTAILYINTKYVSKNSVHLKKYLSRQHTVAGKTGRNIIIVWHDDNEILSAEDYIKPSKWSFSHWKGYLNAVHKKATLDSFCFGVITGLAQAALTGAMGLIQYGVTPHVAVLAASVFGFGSVIGTFSSTYRNIIFYSDSKISQISKQSVVSFAFAYMIASTIHPLNFMDYVSLMFNIFLSSSAKNEFSQWARIKDLERADTKEYTAKIPFLNKYFSFSERDVNYQLKVQLTTQAIRTADLFGYSVPIPTSFGIYNIELGKILLWLSAPIVNFSVKKWANKNYPETAKTLGLDKSYKEMFINFIHKIADQIKINPLKWKTLLTDAEIKMETDGIKTIYVKSLAATIDQKFRITDLQINRLITKTIFCDNIF